MKKKTAAIILNRNLPEVAENLRNILDRESDLVDTFVVESGSDSDKLASNYDFYADWPDALTNGLRYTNGMNYGLKCIRENYAHQYDSYLLLANDTVVLSNNFVESLRHTLLSEPNCGIVSPCGLDWGERLLLQETAKAFWYIHNNCYMVSEDFVARVGNISSTHTHNNYLFDGNNFRGFCADAELIAKGYVNDFMSLVTPHALIREDEKLLKERFSLIKTEPTAENMKLYIDEGLTWMKQKYGFNSRWDMNNYCINAYKQFFDWHPTLSRLYNILGNFN